MKKFIISFLFLVTVSQAQTILHCTDSSSNRYQVNRDGRSSQATFEKLQGDRIVASKVGFYQAGGDINSYYVSLSEGNKRFFLVGRDYHDTGSALTGYFNAFGESRAISCRVSSK